MMKAVLCCVHGPSLGRHFSSWPSFVLLVNDQGNASPPTAAWLFIFYAISTHLLQRVASTTAVKVPTRHRMIHSATILSFLMHTHLLQRAVPATAVTAEATPAVACKKKKRLSKHKHTLLFLLVCVVGPFLSGQNATLSKATAGGAPSVT
eukprot:1143644-Pelagomonas_calceolata.AAC.2